MEKQKTALVKCGFMWMTESGNYNPCSVWYILMFTRLPATIKTSVTLQWHLGFLPYTVDVQLFTLCRRTYCQNMKNQYNGPSNEIPLMSSPLSWNTSTFLDTRALMCVCMCFCAHVCMCISVYVCMHTYVQAHMWEEWHILWKMLQRSLTSHLKLAWWGVLMLENLGRESAITVTKMPHPFLSNEIVLSVDRGFSSSNDIGFVRGIWWGLWQFECNWPPLSHRERHY